MFEIYRDAAGEWRWRFRAANGEIMADSAEGYTRHADAFRALRTFRELATDADVDGSREEADASS